MILKRYWHFLDIFNTSFNKTTDNSFFFIFSVLLRLINLGYSHNYLKLMLWRRVIKKLYLYNKNEFNERNKNQCFEQTLITAIPILDHLLMYVDVICLCWITIIITRVIHMKPFVWVGRLFPFLTGLKNPKKFSFVSINTLKTSWRQNSV